MYGHHVCRNAEPKQQDELLRLYEASSLIEIIKAIEDGKASETFSSHSATLTTIECIKDMGTPVTGVEEIDSQNTLWQLNWVQVLEPP